MGNILNLNQFKSIPPFTERRRTRKREITVQELIQGLPVFAYRNLTDDIEVTIIQADQELPVMVDVIQVGRALSTFIEKARETLPGGGHLTITTGLMKFKDGLVYGQNRSTSAFAFISISDTGFGMYQETMSKIFEPGVSTEGGIGLPIAYRTIKQHYGSINIESKPGQGTTVKIYLPLVQKRSAHPEKIPLPPAGAFVSLPRSIFKKSLTGR